MEGDTALKERTQGTADARTSPVAAERAFSHWVIGLVFRCWTGLRLRPKGGYSG